MKATTAKNTKCPEMSFFRAQECRHLVCSVMILSIAFGLGGASPMEREGEGEMRRGRKEGDSE